MSAGTDAYAGELDRIRDEYARRERELGADAYQAARPANLFIRQALERAVLRALGQHDLLPLAGRRVLDVGCGTGQWLVDLETWGVQRGDLAGIDLVPKRVELSEQRVAGADVRLGSASQLPWEEGSFDIVLQVMLLSSVLDDGLRRAIGAEMDRVLAPGGAIVSLDFFVGNPGNRSVKPLTRADLRRLFPGYDVHARRAVLAPPLVRALAPRAWGVASLLQSARLFDTHSVAVMTRS